MTERPKSRFRATSSRTISGEGLSTEDRNAVRRRPPSPTMGGVIPYFFPNWPWRLETSTQSIS